MKLEKLIKIASRAYPHSGLIQKYFDNPDGGYGDGLAHFIMTELSKCCYDGTKTLEQLDEAIDRLDHAISELVIVREAIINEKLDYVAAKWARRKEKRNEKVEKNPKFRRL